MPEVDGVRVAQTKAGVRRQAFEVFGFEGEAAKLTEEMGELQAALIQYMDGRASATEVYEEMVGVKSTLDSLEHWAEEEITRSSMTQIEIQQTERLQDTLREVLHD